MSSTNSHPSIYSSVAGLGRRGFPPPQHPSNKPSPSLSQHASPYQPTYQPQQPPPSQYPHHLFSQAPPPIPSVASIQNAARQSSQAPPSLPGPRSRAPPPRQVQHQQQPTPPPLTYLQQAMNQPLSQQSATSQSMSSQSLNPQPLNPQQLSQQSLNHHLLPSSLSQQGLGQQSLGHQSLGGQPLGQQSLGSQSMGQQLQPISQPPMAQPMTQSLSHQSLSQPGSSVQSVQSAQQSENSILSQQPTPQPAPQSLLPSVPTSVPQVQKVQQVQPVQQQPTPPQPEPAEPAQDRRQDHDTEMGNHDESGEGDTSLEPKVLEGTPFVPRQPMGPMMSAPPEGGSFPTLEAVHKHVLTYCTSVGYAIVIGRSKKTVPGLKKVLFVCDRAGKPPKRVSPELRKRKTTSRKCDCQFGFFAIEQRTQWTVRYRPDPSHLEHNHGPSESPLLHPAARKLDSKMVAAVRDLKDSGVGVSQTLEILQQEHPHVPLLPRDIYNARAAITRNPQKVNAALTEDRPAIYSKPHPSADERIRADLRREISKVKEDYDNLVASSKKEIEDLKQKLREKDKIIEKFEQFIDICNQRVLVSLNKDDSSRGAGAPAT
ncbi:hypothetical protein QBC35DRAFT_483729 [Podospora australis]|uniref:PKS-NRPS hybrid synthetase n=1 Tax=Podospora australis TaxID=1536484 RepID=A0AAN6X376_9PEZI|nr:hypothetical protein QBC35DRAFT_483729 [Podospora australis]